MVGYFFNNMNLIEIIGYLAAILTMLSSLPQIIKTLKTKSTKDISFFMILLLWSGILLWLVYGILIKSAPVIFANSISLFFISIFMIIKIKYS